MTQESTTLYYREGSSDKVYQAAIEAVDGGFLVTFAFGRRGSTLQTGTKTLSPVPLEQAKSVFDKLVRSKLAKGYTPGADGTPYQHTIHESRDTGLRPQLCNPVESEEVKHLLASPDYLMQEKFDGKRVLIQRTVRGALAINRQGLTIALPASITQSAEGIPAEFILDGECVGDVYHAFDLLGLNEEDLRDWPYEQRHAALLNLLSSTQHPQIELVETPSHQGEKSRLFLRLKGAGKEGVVFKHRDAPYTPGRPASGGAWLKFKFTTTGSFLVTVINAQRSVGLGVFDGSNRLEVGNVTIPANKPVPAVGDIVEVRYLYAYPRGSLYQPVFLTKRDDLEPRDCTVRQLKFKSQDSDEEETPS